MKNMNRVEMNDEMLERVIGGADSTKYEMNESKDITLSDLSKILKRVSSGMKINSACIV